MRSRINQWLAKLFHIEAEGAAPSAQQRLLLEQAEQRLRQLLAEHQDVVPFALALGVRGEVQYAAARSDRAPDEALVDLLQWLQRRVQADELHASLLCKPMVSPLAANASAVLFDMEQRQAPRVVGLLSYRRSDGAVEFGDISFQQLPGKLFPA